MAKKKYYVVWNGVVPGIYSDWTACKLQVYGFQGARYKSFESKEEAEEAYLNGEAVVRKSERKVDIAAVHREGLAVDAACSGNPGNMEYRGVCLSSRQQVFRQGPFKMGTNNIGEFLALVHALALLKKEGSDLPIYSDSRNAILWIKQKKCKTKLQRIPANEILFELIARAENWLKTNTYTTRIIKWETKIWGEIPADFGRK